MQAPPKRWKKRPALKPDTLAELQAALPDLKLTPLQWQILVNRDIVDPHALHAEPEDDYTPLPPHLTLDGMRATLDAFLNAAAAPLPSPFAITGMDKAVERIERALKDKETIAVYGDYDADGVTSTVLLTQALRAFGAQVVIHVPHRKRDGYGLNKPALDTLAGQGVRLVITVDCGISNVAEVEHGQGQGLDLIVTDHHTPPAITPHTIVINPKYAERAEAFADLTGVGVAHQVVRALVSRLGKPPGLRNNDLLELVAIGTVADIAPLVGANRSLVILGLNCLRKTSRPGMLALLQAAGTQPSAVNVHTIGFVIAPRINAAGRLDDAKLAYDLLLTEDKAEATKLAQELNTENARRQEKTRAIQDEARKRVAELEQDEPVIILRDRNWDVGVVGLAAGRLCEEYGRPALVLADEGEVSRGSGRSTKHVNLHEVLTEVADLLSHFGGHHMAAGFTVPNKNYEEFCERVRELISEILDDESQLSGELQADYELPLAEANLETMAALAALEPFGPGNERPLFVARNLQVTESKANGKDGNTLSLMLVPAGGAGGPAVRAVGFGMGAEWVPKLADKPRIDLMFHLDLDEWQGQQRVQLRIRGLRLSKVER